MARTAPASTTGLPRDRAFDATLALLRDGYAFGARRCRALGTDAFRTRIALRKVVFALGADAAAMFYHPGRFTRRGAIPPTVVALLQDFGSVQRQDGLRHRRRKRLFLDLLGPVDAARLAALLHEEWRARAARWAHQDRIVLLDESRAILARVACRWAGVPLPGDGGERLSRDLGATVDGAGSFGPRLLRGLIARRRVERWAREIIRKVRDCDSPDAATPVAAIAHYREEDGEPLPVATAAVELVNLLRPTVAVAQWIAFAALALHRHPRHRSRLRGRDPALLLGFAQEVRRFYPFFPMIGGRVRAPFEWRGRRFEAGDWVLLDLYGTDHDPRLWAHPERFDPARFAGWRGGAYELIPQGAGDPATGHRCPGEDASIALLTAAIDELANGMRYDVPEQDLSYRLDRFPAKPASGFVLRNVRLPA